MSIFAGRMSNIIQLLPDHVANQIAAGEVIQRPASAVKELMENAVDAGATNIQLIIKDGGRTLIQVIDNGCGMSDLDARMAFARHATSKIRHADDLWSIRTMGFRGEAMASIAAIAHVELRTREADSDIGTLIEIEGTEVKRQEPVSTPVGTSISVKNLFYNVPARRNFLKSNPVETRHIFEEFNRVALSFPSIEFRLYNNDQEVFRLKPGSLKQRIISLFGKPWEEKLVPVREHTNLISISGFIGKPEFTRRTRGEQFFFINNRFIKNSYLNHAVQAAYQGLIAPDSFPAYFIFFEADPKTIDINIHPTKTEIKFEDERSVYAILRSAVKKSIGSFSLSPSLDFESEAAFEIPLPPKGAVKAPEIRVNPDYNPFKVDGGMSSVSRARWESLYPAPEQEREQATEIATAPGFTEIPERTLPWSLHGRYIFTQVKSGVMVIDHQGARERIFYERFLKQKEDGGGHSQQLLFPVVKEFSGPDYELIMGLQPEFRALGFEFEIFGKHTILVKGAPPEVAGGDIKKLIDQVLEQFKLNRQQLSLSRIESLAKTLAMNAARAESRYPSPEQMLGIVDQLFACDTPGYSPFGRPIVSIIGLEELAAKFGK